MERAVAYSRVSTDAQKREGTSLDTQDRGCAELAAARGWSLVRSIRDAASGFDLDREGIEMLRGMLRRGEVDVMVAFAVDRLSRNQNHMGVLFDEIEQAGASLEFVTERFEDTAIGRFILAARAFIAEVEREKIAERTMRGKAERARSGRLPQGTGRGIYGYRYDAEVGTRQIVQEQAHVVRRVFEEFATGGSCHGIAVRLNGECVPAFSGGRWYALTVRRILLNEAYTGRTVYRRTRVEKVRDPARGRWVRRVSDRAEADWIEIEGVTPAIVSLELFRRAQSRLTDPDRRRRSGPSRAYSLRGRVRCAQCGAAMVGHAANRGRYHYYRCANGSSGPDETRCGARYIQVKRLEEAVKSAFADLLGSPDRLLDEVRSAATAEPTASDGLTAIVRELDEIEARQRRLVQLFTRDDLPEDILAWESRSLADQRTALESRRRTAEPIRPTSRLDVDQLERELPRVLLAIRSWVASAEGDDFDLLLRAVDARITASTDAVEIRGEVPLIAEVPQSFATIEQTSA